jgi:hypothetical protein
MAGLIFQPSLRVFFLLFFVAGPFIAYLGGHLTGSVVRGLDRERRVPVVLVLILAACAMAVTGYPFDWLNLVANITFNASTAGFAPMAFVRWPGQFIAWHVLGLFLGGLVLGRKSSPTLSDA